MLPSIVFVGIMKAFFSPSYPSFQISNLKYSYNKYLTYSYFLIINLQYICGHW